MWGQTFSKKRRMGETETWRNDYFADEKIAALRLYGSRLNMSIIYKEAKTVELGIYQTKDGKEYDCHFMQDAKIAEAVGPLPESDQVGSRGVAFKVEAESEQEARQNLALEIGPGHWA